MLLFALLLLQPLPPPMPVDEEPSALACTFDAALAGARCLYEAAPGPGAPRDNSQAAASAGQRACAGEAARDDGLRKDCESAVAEASLSPKCAVAARLFDAQGRLTPQAAGCVEAVREAVARTARAAALSLDCCRCLGAARCPVAASQCRRELADLSAGAALQACLGKACSSACAFAAPATPARTQPPPADKSADKI